MRTRPRALSPEDIGNVVRFLPIIEALPKEQITVDADEDEPVIRLEVTYHPQVHALMQALFENGFVQPFDWGKWQREAEVFVLHPESLRTADLATCVKLITTHVRKDRFCSGHFGAMINCRHITALLRRLAELRVRMRVGGASTGTTAGSRRDEGTTRLGYENRNGQVVIRKTDQHGTDYGQYVYVLRCTQCNHQYGVNGSDIFQRKCPRCQGGRPSLEPV